MPRKARKRGLSAIYHIVVQSAKNQAVFKTPAAKAFYLERLMKYESEFHLDLYAYCVLDTHAHILVGEGDIGISELMRRMNVSFASWYRRHREDEEMRLAHDAGEPCPVGSIFRGRYLSEPLEMALVPGTIRYIELEPWRHGLVEEDEHYPYASSGLRYSSAVLSRIMQKEKWGVSETDASYGSEPFMYLEESVYKYGKTPEEGRASVKRRLGTEDPLAALRLKRDEQENLIRALRYQDHLSINLICKVTGLGRGLVMRVKK